MLDTSEMRAYHDFVHSPFFNKNEKLCQMAGILLESYPGFEEKHVKKENVAKVLFGNDAKAEQKLNDHASYLVTLLHEFYAISGFKNEEIEKRLYTLRSLQNKEHGLEFERIAGQLKNIIEKNPNRNSDYHYHNYLLENEFDQYYLSKNERDKHDRFQNKVDALDAFYLSQKLKAACEMLNRQKVFTTVFSHRMMEQIADYIEANTEYLSELPSVMVYYHCFNMLSQPEIESHFIQLKGELEKSSGVLPNTELRELYDYLQNFCIQKINKGETGYFNTLLEIYKSLLSNEIIYENGYLSEWDYKNIVSTGLRLKDYQWTEKFITEYKEKLHPDMRKNAYIYNLASLHYEKKEHSLAIKLLREIEFTDVFYSLGARSILLKTYYEMHEDESLYSSIDSFKTFLRRNKLISDYQKSIYQNLLKYTLQLNRIREDLEMDNSTGNIEKYNKLKETLGSAKETANIGWLTEQAKLLRKE